MIRHKHTDIDPAVIPYRISYFIRYTVIEMTVYRISYFIRYTVIEMTVYRIYGKSTENTVCRIRILEP
jgi:hypothetical protein